MRLLVGIAIGGQVVEMTLPAGVPLAHLLPEVRATITAETGVPVMAQLVPRRVDGEWFDLERSLREQECASGSLICLEERETTGRTPHHDPVVAVAERGPPAELVPEGAVVLIIGAVLGVLLASSLGSAAVVVVAGAPVIWAVLPLLGGVAPLARTRRLLQVTSAGASAAAVASSGLIASLGPMGVALDSCVAGVVFVHVGRRRSTNALLRVTLGALEWWLLGAILPLTVVAAGWSGW